MGNRAVITTSDYITLGSERAIGIYLHWNGGYDSIKAFLTYCKIRGFRGPETDNSGWANLCTVISNFFGEPYGLSVGIDRCCNLDCDNGDNGVYIIKNWGIVGRKYAPERKQNTYPLDEMVWEIDQAQPEDVHKFANLETCKEYLAGRGYT